MVQNTILGYTGGFKIVFMNILHILENRKGSYSSIEFMMIKITKHIVENTEPALSNIQF